ncbi:hypothetical protein VQ7734_01669 [Vibrio quintilis]|uniref:Uncharacterized protein n=1 Tax=Vibrio quintilis TaxID=1117707 RepID=A0A1M7YTK2_9VIBR|nr:hypothetical protein VQ7734_01669 [Vibrio quintilis]
MLYVLLLYILVSRLNYIGDVSLFNLIKAKIIQAVFSLNTLIKVSVRIEIVVVIGAYFWFESVLVTGMLSPFTLP